MGLLLLRIRKGSRKRKEVRNQKKKSEAFDLSTLSESLPDLKAAKKSRKRLVLNGRKAKIVPCHPAFLPDWLAAIDQYVQDENTDNKPERVKQLKCELMKEMNKGRLRQERQERKTGKLLESMEKLHL